MRTKYSLLFFLACAGFLYNFSDRMHYQPPMATPASKVRFSGVLNTHKHVTKSLRQLGKMEDINKHIIFFNRIPHSGSEILVLLIQWLQGWNNFRHVRLKDGGKSQLSSLDQEKLVYEVMDYVKNGAVPFCFDRFVRFVNFSSFGKQSPTFVNVIRDPVDSVLSR